MNLRGKYLILIQGPRGSRKSDIAGLLAGGSAYLSMLVDWTKARVVDSASGVKAGGLPSEHTTSIVISSDDCFWVNTRNDDGKLKREFIMRPDKKLEALSDVCRRVRIAMARSYCLVIVTLDVDIPYSFSMDQLYDLARANQYEVVTLFLPDFRVDVAKKRMKQLGITPDKATMEEYSVLDDQFKQPINAESISVFLDNRDETRKGLCHVSGEQDDLPKINVPTVDAENLVQGSTEHRTESETSSRLVVRINSFPADDREAHRFLKGLGVTSVAQRKTIVAKSRAGIPQTFSVGTLNCEDVRKRADETDVSIEVVDRGEGLEGD